MSTASPRRKEVRETFERFREYILHANLRRICAVLVLVALVSASAAVELEPPFYRSSRSEIALPLIRNEILHRTIMMPLRRVSYQVGIYDTYVQHRLYRIARLDIATMGPFGDWITDFSARGNWHPGGHFADRFQHAARFAIKQTFPASQARNYIIGLVNGDGRPSDNINRSRIPGIFYWNPQSVIRSTGRSSRFVKEKGLNYLRWPYGCYPGSMRYFQFPPGSIGLNLCSNRGLQCRRRLFFCCSQSSVEDGKGGQSNDSGDASYPIQPFPHTKLPFPYAFLWGAPLVVFGVWLSGRAIDRGQVAALVAGDVHLIIGGLFVLASAVPFFAQFISP